MPTLPKSLFNKPGIFQPPGRNEIVMFDMEDVIVATQESGSGYVYETSANPDPYPRLGSTIIIYTTDEDATGKTAISSSRESRYDVF